MKNLARISLIAFLILLSWATNGIAQTTYPQYSGSFEEAFSQARNELGKDQVFIWQNKPFTTNYENESFQGEYREEGPETVQAKEEKETIAQAPGLDRSKPPLPGPAPEIKVAEPNVFTLSNGLTVYVVENHKLPRVTFSLVVDRDPILEGDKAGYVSFAGSLMRMGTKNRTKSEIDQAIDFIGASLSTSSTGVSAQCLSRHIDTLLAVMSDVIKHPTFPEDELEKLREQSISGLKSAEKDPESVASRVQSALLYGKDHPYGELTSEATLQAITSEDCRAYYHTYFRPNISHLAVVGDISTEDIRNKLEERLGDWPRAEVPEHQYAFPERPSSMQIDLVDRPESVQSVILLSQVLDLHPANPDVFPIRVMNYILGGGTLSRLYKNLREDKGYTYGIFSSYDTDPLVGEFSMQGSVRNEVTDSAIHEMLYELERMQSEPVSEEEIELVKAAIFGSFGRALESPATVARFAINKAIYDLPDNYYTNWLKSVGDVTSEQVQEVAKEYLTGEKLHAVIVGNAGEIAEPLAQLGQVTYYDFMAEEVEKQEMELPENLTAKDVLDQYVEALGGKERLQEVTSMRMILETEFQGMPMKIESIQKLPDMGVQTISLNGSPVNQSVYNNGKGVVLAMGQRKEMDSAELADAALENMPFPELKYDEMGVTSELVQMAEVNGNATYVIKLTYPSGKHSRHYFDTDSGLKLKQTAEIETPQGVMTQEVNYLEYEQKEGITYPSVIEIPLGPNQVRATVTTVEINPELEDTLFELP